MNAGVVTAYGAAVQGGYTGTYAQFCALMASIDANHVRNIWTGRCTDRFPKITTNKTVVLDDPEGFSLTNGVIIAVSYIGNAENITNPCINVNGTGNVPISVPFDVDLEEYHLRDWGGSVTLFQYEAIGGGRWRLCTVDLTMWENLVDAINQRSIVATDLGSNTVRLSIGQ